MPIDPELEPLFPDHLLRPTIGQAASWTTVEAIVAAARTIEGRAGSSTDQLWIAFPDNELLQALLIRVFSYFFQDYHCSREKLALARHVDPMIQSATIDALGGLRLRPTMNAGGPSVARRVMPKLGDAPPMRVLSITDDPPSLEVAFEPLQMLRTTLVSLFTEASEVRNLQTRVKAATGGHPKIVHRPYGDGPLLATLDALVYFALGLEVGIQSGAEQASIEHGFRSVNIVGQLPFQSVHFDMARAQAPPHKMGPIRS